MPSRLPAAWFVLAALTLVLPAITLSLTPGAFGLILASLMNALSAAAAATAMGFAYRYFIGSAGAGDIRIAGWIHWTLWLLATLTQSLFWMAQARVLTGTSISQTATALGAIGAIGGVLHLLGWFAFLAAVASARRQDLPSRPGTFS